MTGVKCSLCFDLAGHVRLDLGIEVLGLLCGNLQRVALHVCVCVCVCVCEGLLHTLHTRTHNTHAHTHTHTHTHAHAHTHLEVGTCHVQSFAAVWRQLVQQGSVLDTVNANVRERLFAGLCVSECVSV
jgi:hypothetical protein